MQNKSRFFARFCAAFLVLATGAMFFAGCDDGGGTEFAITFNPNGGGGTAPNPILAVAGAGVTLPGPGGLTMSGYSFHSWNTAADGSGTSHNEGAVIPMPNGSITLFATWGAVGMAITWTAQPAAGETTPAINFTFSEYPGALSTANITIASGGGSATPVTLSGVGVDRTLMISDVIGGNVSVFINRAGIASAPQPVTLSGPAAQQEIAITVMGIPWHYHEGTAFLTLLEPGTQTQVGIGSATPSASTTFTVVAGPGIYDLSLILTSDMGVGGAATYVRSNVNIPAGSTSMAFSTFESQGGGIPGMPQPPQPPGGGEAITWTANAVGSPFTTAIVFTFNRDPGFLSVGDFTITPVSGNALTTGLTGGGTSRILNIEVIQGGDVLVSIDYAPASGQGPQLMTLLGP